MRSSKLLLNLKSLAVFAAGLAWYASGLGADVKLAPLFDDHAVLQREQPVPVWGEADPGTKISVSFAGQEKSTTSGPDGKWSVALDALRASAEPRELVVTSDNRKSKIEIRKLHDVVVGDVWLCSGQSNMEFAVEHVVNAPDELATANFPLLRSIMVRRQTADTPQTDTRTTGWLAASPENARYFTAVGFFFAREIHQQLGVPVGIVRSCYSGTRIEAWMSAAAFARDPAFAKTIEAWRADNVIPYAKRKADYDAAIAAWKQDEAAAKTAGEEAHRTFLKTHRRPSSPMGPEQGPSTLFNAMIAPLVPYALRGVLWYQGESNAWAPAGGQHPALDYRRQFPVLIETWREHFGRPDLPFYWVQLAGYETSHDWPTLREAQTLTLALPNTGQAVAIDVGEANDIHPRNKQAVGHRLALIARAKTYGESIEYSGPVLRSAQRDGATWRLQFDHAKGGLVVSGDQVTSLEVAGADRVFHPATGRVDGDTLTVTSAEASEPVAVRYAWRSYPAANLYNAEGLPAGPFRTDNW